MTFREGACVFLTGAVAYPALELATRRRTHWTMGLAGGSCLLALYALSGRLQHRRLSAKCILGALTISAIELATGLVVNRLLKWNVWDYTNHRVHLMGQICPAYSCLWFLLCVPAYALCGLFRRGFDSLRRAA